MTLNIRVVEKKKKREKKVHQSVLIAGFPPSHSEK